MIGMSLFLMKKVSKNIFNNTSEIKSEVRRLLSKVFPIKFYGEQSVSFSFLL